MARTAEIKKVGYTGRTMPATLKKLHDLKWKKKTTFSELMEEIIDFYLTSGAGYKKVEK